MTLRSHANRLRRDSEGATIVEFAIVAPILCMMLVGMFDFGFRIYAQSVLQGAVQDAARSATLEGGNLSQTAIDNLVTTRVQNVVPAATMAFQRKNYSSFSEVGMPEDFNDTNSNDICDNGEAFQDLNGNNLWDTDRGRSGVGGARDAVLYTATVSYTRLFPIDTFIKTSPDIVIEGTTVLRNQPYTEQEKRVATVGNCT